jgi:hypothetical protein
MKDYLDFRGVLAVIVGSMIIAGFFARVDQSVSIYVFGKLLIANGVAAMLLAALVLRLRMKSEGDTTRHSPKEIKTLKVIKVDMSFGMITSAFVLGGAVSVLIGFIFIQLLP